MEVSPAREQLTKSVQRIVIQVWINLCHVTKWGKMADMQNSDSCCSSKWQMIWIKVCRALVTRYIILPPYQNLKQVNHSYVFQLNLPFLSQYLVAMLWRHQILVYIRNYSSPFPPLTYAVFHFRHHIIIMNLLFGWKDECAQSNFSINS